MSVPRFTAVLLAALLVVGACGAPSATAPARTAAASPVAPTVAAPAAPTVAAPAAPARTKVRMNTFGNCSEPWNWWAQEKGVYQKYGLDMEQIRLTGGAASLASVVGGSVDFGAANGFSAITAFAQGFPIQFVAGGSVAPLPPLPQAMGVWVKSDSPIKAAADLKGKKVGVNEIGGLNQIVTSAWLKKQGVDPTDVRFVALPFAQLVPAVLQGTIDATQIPHNVVPTASVSQVRTIADPFQALGSKIMSSGYFASKDFVAKSPKAAESFYLAIKESSEAIFDPKSKYGVKDEALEIMARGCKGDLAVIKNTPQLIPEPVVDPAVVGQMAQFMVDQNLLGAAPKLEALIAPFATKK